MTFPMNPAPPPARRCLSLALGLFAALASAPSGAASPEATLSAWDSPAVTAWPGRDHATGELVPQTEDQKIIASDGARLHAFGHAAVLQGDTAMVGATDVRAADRSAVYVFTRSNGTWTETQRFYPNDGRVGDKDNFGASIAIDGDTAVIGAVGAKVGNNVQQGAAYVFKRVGGVWQEAAKLVASDGTQNVWFGESVAIAGSTIVVSGYGATIGSNFQQGAAYVFTESNGTWTETQKVVSDDGGPDDQFGYRVALSDTSLLIGARLANNNWLGALYVFKKQNGVWTQTQKFSGSASYDGLARSLVARGNRAAVGSIGVNNRGTAYIYTEIDGTWVRTAELPSGETATSLNYGYSIAMSDTSVLVGADRVTVDGRFAAGAGFLFTESNGMWSLAQKFVASDPQQEDSLGQAAALDGTTALVASPRVTVNGDFLRGAAYFYTAETGTRPAAAVVDRTELDFAVQAGGADSSALTIGNAGGSDLLYSVAEDVLARRAGATISQMADNAPGNVGASCGATGARTSVNSWWRRFYFSEHPEVGASAVISGVTISSGTIEQSSGGPATLPVSVRLYTIPRSVATDTIPTSALSLIGSGNGSVVNGLVSTTIPVSGTVVDTATQDLVVEYHTEGNASGGKFFPGANSSPETHPTFMSAQECGISQPTRVSEVGFPNFHLTMLVHLDGGAPGTCRDPVDVPWLAANPASGVVAPAGEAAVSVNVDASALAPGDYSAQLCLLTSDPLKPLIQVPVSLTVTAAPITDRVFCDGFDGAACAAR
ncbi:FG-GAP repeat protein [Dokdonella sp.]|uniref:FG-GAP repeat protein n=1 Tax=Dokdonella sp. TaxID=2291710 RepID=UPI0026222AD5|nr:FG-GAP repeat protein [Dokdonella sp.]